ncbi:MAG: hypothetical protein OEL55_00295 [Desulfobulbaceae bacterium]|nr:hypothetical protein [Desulfobulbaceae bacterium]
MIEFRKTVTRLMIRLALAGLVTWYGRYLIDTARTGVIDVPRLLAAMLCFVLAALVCAPQLLGFVTELVGNVMGSGGFGGCPAPYYRPAAEKRARGRYEEAMLELQKIAIEHPRERHVYLEMLAVAFTDLGDQKRAYAICNQGKRALNNQREMDILDNAYKKGCAKLAASS